MLWDCSVENYRFMLAARMDHTRLTILRYPLPGTCDEMIEYIEIYSKCRRNYAWTLCKTEQRKTQPQSLAICTSTTPPRLETCSTYMFLQIRDMPPYHPHRSRPKLGTSPPTRFPFKGHPSSQNSNLPSPIHLLRAPLHRLTLIPHTLIVHLFIALAHSPLSKHE